MRKDDTKVVSLGDWEDKRYSEEVSIGKIGRTKGLGEI